MRLQFLRTSDPERAGGPWMVMDEDAPVPQNYNPVFVGTAEQCGKYVQVMESAAFADVSHEARHTIARNAATAQAEAVSRVRRLIGD
jgi:hypothetical protein